MTIKKHNVEQNTDEWLQLRLGIITASNVNKIVTATGKPAKNESMRQYAAQLAAQRITKRIEDNFQTWDTLRGHLQEDIARDYYSDNYAPVEKCGFITNDSLGFTIGCSPDGLVDCDGGIEIKSRLAKFQVETIVADEVPREFVNQVQTFLLVSGRDWCDFVQYSNGMPLYVKRVTVDPVRREAIVNAMMEFEEEIERIRMEYLHKAESLNPD